ncbi:MAG: hypothetical protein J5668_02495, partial [Bacteroidales bacterium]|nr:hypothetical protein [Bacteroidales bacterium]
MKFPAKIFWRILLVVYLAAVAYLCFASQGGLPKFDDWPFKIPADKVVHFLMFLPWPILASLSVMPDRSSVMTGSDRASMTPDRVGGDVKIVIILLIITLIGCALAGTTEWIQGLLPYRSRDIMDFIADSLGLMT